MFVDFFIRRPVFAAVTALLITLAGAICAGLLPVAEFPILQPPTVDVDATYIGASAQTVETAVTQLLEERINGVQGMKYLESETVPGGVEIEATFDVDRDPDLAAVDIQNRVSRVAPRLPAEVNRAGVSVRKGGSQSVCAIALISEHGEYSNLFMSNYADVYVRNALARIPGVSLVRIFGERKYAMRIWLDPVKLAARKLTAGDVVNALTEQNVQVAAGVIGAPPAAPTQLYELSVRALGRMTTPEEFGRLILKTGQNGTLVLLQDVARIELGAEDYSLNMRYRGADTVGMEVLQLPDANALEVDRAVRAKMEELAKGFPPGLKYQVAVDPTLVVRSSLTELGGTLVASVLLVMLVIFFFLQSGRGTLISALTIPVSLVGTFIFVKLFNFSINTLTLFGLTLATGLVVDDAIVVIENIERHLEAGETSPARAAALAMREVTGAVIATSLVLVAVFVPVAFFPGITGRLYRQFSLTIAFSVAISTFNALTLTPSLSALLLTRRDRVRGLAAGIGRGLERLTALYTQSLSHVLKRYGAVLLLFAAGIGATVWLFQVVPRGFAPNEDRGYFFSIIQGPEGSSLEVTTDVVKQVERVLSPDADVDGVFTFVGDGAANRAFAFVVLKPEEKRRGKGHDVASVVDRVRPQLNAIPGAVVMAFLPAPLPGVSSLGGFTLKVLDQGIGSLEGLASATQDLVHAGNQDPKLDGLFTQFAVNTPQLRLTVDRARAKGLNVPFDEVANALEIYLGSAYVNDFDFNNRSYRVFVQADQPFRAEPKDLGQLYLRNQKGAMLPLQSLIQTEETTAPQVIDHFNLFRSAEVSGSPAKGVSSGQALEEMQRLAREVLPAGSGIAWTGIALEELSARRTTLIIFALALVFVYLVLAALYESFLLPLIILLAVPLGLLGALGAQALRGLENDVYCQIGLVLLVGLASKNAILIIEFAEQLRGRGRALVEAAREAARERLRPILMTSFAFILGMLPLVFASGAGKNSRHSLGTAVVGGMVVSTLLNLYVTPVLYVLATELKERLGGRRANHA